MSIWQRFKDKPIDHARDRPGTERLDQTRCALAMMENLDANVGRVLQRLDALKLSGATRS